MGKISDQPNFELIMTSAFDPDLVFLLYDNTLPGDTLTNGSTTVPGGDSTVSGNSSLSGNGNQIPQVTDTLGVSLAGTGAADIIRGNIGRDSLYGRGGGDTIFGDDGEDLIDGETHQDRHNYSGLARAADLIGQLSDPRYLKKISSLFYEFEEVGTNKVLGYKTPGDLRRNYAKFYWNGVFPYIPAALKYLELTQEGKQIVANLYANVFQGWKSK